MPFHVFGLRKANVKRTPEVFERSFYFRYRLLHCGAFLAPDTRERVTGLRKAVARGVLVVCERISCFVTASTTVGLFSLS